MKRIISSLLIGTTIIVMGVSPVFASAAPDKVYADDILDGLGKLISGETDPGTAIQEGIESGKSILQNIGKNDNKTEKGTDNSEDTNDTKTDFDPQDVSDETIESIRTYGDYLIMYGKIVDDYLVNYENAFKNTVLYDEAVFQDMRDEMDEAIKEQEKEYGAMKNAPLVGKNDLVDYLKEYRDTLKSMTDAYAEMMESLQ